jgi:hypothetical protein
MDFIAKYDKTKYINFFRDNLLPEDFESDEQEIQLDFKSKYFNNNSVTYIGKSNKIDLGVYEVRHSSENGIPLTSEDVLSQRFTRFTS